MQYQQRFPWLSLAILITAYGAFGWYLFSPESVRYTWILIEAFVLLLALFLTVPMENTGLRLIAWTASSGTTLILAVFVGFLILFVLLILRVVQYILIVTAASALARLGMQTIGLRQWQVFALLISCSFLGLGLGWSIRQTSDLFYAGSAMGSALQQWVVPD